MGKDDSRSLSNAGGYDARTETYRVYHDWAEDGPIGTTIARAVAALDGVEPVARRPLHEVLDADALDALLRPTSVDSSYREGAVVFRYHGHEVTVHSSGEVVIEPAEGESG